MRRKMRRSIRIRIIRKRRRMLRKRMRTIIMTNGIMITKIGLYPFIPITALTINTHFTRPTATTLLTFSPFTGQLLPS